MSENVCMECVGQSSLIQPNSVSGCEFALRLQKSPEINRRSQESRKEEALLARGDGGNEVVVSW